MGVLLAGLWTVARQRVFRSCDSIFGQANITGTATLQHATITLAPNFTSPAAAIETGAFVGLGYFQMIVPDHSPSIADDAAGYGGWGFALGYIRALLKATS
jgi:hypothetical protein